MGGGAFFNAFFQLVINYIVRGAIMEKFVINGGKTLCGKVKISAAKNACLPLIAASLITCGKVTFTECPNISDVVTQLEIFKDYGGKVEKTSGKVTLDTSAAEYKEIDCEKWSSVRASLFFLGAALARFKKAEICRPGGCAIGDRPVDIHIDGLKSLGVECAERENKIYFNAENARAGKVVFRYPSVGATINLVTFAALLKGETEIINAAREPEIVCLCDFLNKLGGDITGAGEKTIIIRGIKPEKLKSELVFTPIKDRIEAATFACAVCACGGEISFDYDAPKNLFFIMRALKKAGCGFAVRDKKAVVFRDEKIRLSPVRAIADVYPALPTDMQPLLCSALLTASGESYIADRVYPQRFSYAGQLKKFGARFKTEPGLIRVIGIEKLTAAKVCACDLRGGAALVAAAFSAEGESEIYGAETIKRGYEDLQKKFSALGGDIKLINEVKER